MDDYKDKLNSMVGAEVLVRVAIDSGDQYLKGTLEKDRSGHYHVPYRHGESDTIRTFSFSVSEVENILDGNKLLIRK